jgi:hypothetical protein
MTRHVFLTVSIVSILAVIIGVLLSPTGEQRESLGYPWEITVLPDGSTSVFKINLGKTNLGEAERLFKEVAELTLFKPRGEQSKAVVEAYFNKIQTGGLKAKLILGFSLNEEQINAIYERGVRISTLGSGERRVTLSSEDEKRMRLAVITSMTYIPSINLQATLVAKRFGTAKSVIIEKESGTMHWLYPEKGVDVAMNENAKEVLQYVLPKNFSVLSQPLMKLKY